MFKAVVKALEKPYLTPLVRKSLAILRCELQTGELHNLNGMPRNSTYVPALAACQYGKLSLCKYLLNITHQIQPREPS